MSTPTPHIEALAGEIAEDILLPGDPLRAQMISDRFLTDTRCYNRVRGMLGFTGTYKGRPMSVQGTGMGHPSMAIYATELFRFYGVRRAIRVGSCGALLERVHLRDLVLAQGCHDDSNLVRDRIPGIAFAATADFGLLRTAADLAAERGLTAHVGTVWSSDWFYDPNPGVLDGLTRHGTLAAEMEAGALYAIAAAEGVRALTIATVSDHLLSHEKLPSAEREIGFLAMAELALDTLAGAPD